MRPMLQPTPAVSKGGARRADIVLKPQKNAIRMKSRRNDTGMVKSGDNVNNNFDDDVNNNGENQAEIANIVPADVDKSNVNKRDNITSSSECSTEGMSLVQRRAALFGNVQSTEKETARKLSDNVVTSIANDEIFKSKEIEIIRPVVPQSSPVDECESNSPTKDTKLTPATAPYKDQEPLVSPSHMDFESKNKAIFNFASKSTSNDNKWVNGGKSYFERKIVDSISDDVKKKKKVAKIDNGDLEYNESCIDSENAQEQSCCAENVESKLPSSTGLDQISEGTLTPQLLKPSQMNFRCTYRENLSRQKTDKSDCGITNVPKPTQAHKKPSDFPTRFSDVLSPTDFPTKFSDIVSPETTKSSVHLSSSLAYSEKKNYERKVALAIDTDVDVALQPEQIFSPLNVQMLSDMVGFTASFSEAIVSPRKSQATKSTIIDASEDVPDPVNEENFFSNFASFTPSNFETDVAMGTHSAQGTIEKGKFFDSPLLSNSNIMLVSPGQDNSTNTHGKTSNVSVNTKKTVVNFDQECKDQVECEMINACDDNSTDELGRELDNILSLKPDQHMILSSSISNNDPPIDTKIHSDNVVFGTKFNEESGAVEDIKNSIGSSGTELEEVLSTIDEADEDLAAQTKIFRESLTPELNEFYSQINTMFDLKVENLEKRVKFASVENSVIKEEMCHQHKQIQSLMVQLESSRDMMQTNKGLMQEVEELRAQLRGSEVRKTKREVMKFMSDKKKKINQTLKNKWL